MRVILELLRIICLFMILGGLAWIVLGNIYAINEGIESYQSIAGLGVYVFLFVLYRNKFQFSDWYKGRGRVKLSKPVTITLVSCSIFMMILPVVFGLV
ncbi:hypothetical protein [Evansella cellulosilytica]|uniref:Uncharacterized protein n=1 Tax=Evansella cellulosilytica (strain ATCC 21833 / DSM 2522 / FERM P-1141 / JCM 9156 / N-4) TaxID=649639 RepID=E6U1F6_EVAC2|nr:hypothetical protein [Evansella cellulosilytica]ADU29203.1 hypothetical protein Bcell_0927 [Evansella cellulosilytica DSM 2522]